MKFTIIGSGNVATHIALQLRSIGEEIAEIFSRNADNAGMLAQKVGCRAVTDIEEISADSDVYLFAVKDDALEDVAKKTEKSIVSKEQLSGIVRQRVFIHTAGSVPMDVFSGIARHYGVLYPMQTFSKSRRVDFSHVPCFIEAADDYTLLIIKGLANRLSETVQTVDSEKRRRLHLAAVFACNLTNHCYRLAEKALEGTDVDFRLFLPLIEETARKVTEMSPRDAQTGPMVRYDTKIMESQLSLIPDERTREIYRLMAESVHEDSCLVV